MFGLDKSSQHPFFMKIECIWLARPVIILIVENLILYHIASSRSCLVNHIREGETIMAEKRNFALRDAEGDETHVFAGTAPRQAALKAATRGFTDIRLREKGTKKVHIFRGERKQVQRPKKAPAWMPQKIWRPSVRKICIEKLEEI
jgi:hypothetical protein